MSESDSSDSVFSARKESNPFSNISREKFDLVESSGLKTIRGKLGVENIPADLNTDFNLSRWWRGLNGDVDTIVSRFQGYISNRKAAKFDAPDFRIKCPQLPYLKKFANYLPISKFGEERVVNSFDNCIVVRIRLKAVDFPQLVNVIRTGEFVMAYFAYCEYLLQTVLSQEQLSGRKSGLICLFDLSNLNFQEYMLTKSQSLSPLSKIRKVCLNFMQQNYCGLLEKIIFLNVPPTFEIFWQSAKCLLAEQTQNKAFVMKNPENLKEILDPDAIPVSFGGKVPVNKQSMRTDPRVKPITPEDYVTPGIIWKDAGAKTGPHHLRMVQNIQPKETFKCNFLVKKSNETLVWQFTTETEVEFSLYRRTAGGEHVFLLPKLCLLTTKLPEEGFHTCEATGEHVFEFRNVGSNVFPMKLEYSIDIVR